MSEQVKIVSLRAENAKRIQALLLKPSANGLTVIGGKCDQGKSTVLDLIAWAAGGNRYKPTTPKRDGAIGNPFIELKFDNGVVSTISGQNSTITVTDSTGKKAGLELLKSFVSPWSIDLPKFISASPTEKTKMLLKIIGVGDTLSKLDADEKLLYEKRHAIGQIVNSKQKHADEMQEYPDAPKQPVSISDLIKTQQEILAKNGMNQQKRRQALVLKDRLQFVGGEISNLENRIEQLEIEIGTMRKQAYAKREEAQKIQDDLNIATKTAEELQDESTAEIEASIADLESINAKVAANQAKAHAQDEAAEHKAQYDDLDAKIESIRQERIDLLSKVKMPYPGVSIENGELVYNGKKWDCWSGSQRLKIGTAIARADNPSCGWVCCDNFESLDYQTQCEFGAWLEQEGLQVIATRVSTNPNECTLIIEDGLPKGETYIDQVMGKEETVTETTTTEEEDDF